MTLSIAGGPAGATLGGTTTVAVQNGLATFSNLTLPVVGTYTLSAIDGASPSATSASFDATPGQLVFSTQPTAPPRGRNREPGSHCPTSKTGAAI